MIQKFDWNEFRDRLKKGLLSWSICWNIAWAVTVVVGFERLSVLSAIIMAAVFAVTAYDLKVKTLSHNPSSTKALTLPMTVAMLLIFSMVYWYAPQEKALEAIKIVLTLVPTFEAVVSYISLRGAK